MTRYRLAATLTIFSVFAGAAAGCGSSSTTLLSPSPLAGRCGLTLDVSSPSMSAAGGAGTVRIQTDRECAWSIPQQPSWVKLTQPINGTQGPAEIAFVVDENRSTSLRSWEVVVADQRAVISQEAAICSLSLSPAKISIGATGGNSQTVLTTEDFCSWELPSPASWISITPERGTGAAEITVRVSRNTGDARAERVQVSNAAIEVAQREAPPSPSPLPPAPTPPAPVPTPESPAPAPPPMVPTIPPAAPCTVTLTPGLFNASASAASVSVSVNSPAECAWSVTGAPNWVTASPKSGTGSGTLKIAASANAGLARSAVLLVGGSEFRVEQAQLPPCTYTVLPDRLTLSRKKQHALIGVGTQSHCQWSASSNASWLKVSSDTRTGIGALDVKVDEYSRTGTRSAVVTITGQSFSKDVTITQANNSDDDD